jgi:hypothetical protein
MGILKPQDGAGILYGRGHLETIADDARITEEAFAIRVVVGCHAGDGEIVVGSAERVPLLQDREPAEAGLVDLQDEALEEEVVILDGKAVFEIVIRPVERMAVGRVAVGVGGKSGHGGPWGLAGMGKIGSAVTVRHGACPTDMTTEYQAFCASREVKHWKGTI